MPSRRKPREAETAILISGKVGAKPKLVGSVRKGIYLLIKEVIYQEYIMDIYIYMYVYLL